MIHVTLFATASIASYTCKRQSRVHLQKYKQVVLTGRKNNLKPSHCKRSGSPSPAAGPRIRWSNFFGFSLCPPPTLFCWWSSLTETSIHITFQPKIANYIQMSHSLLVCMHWRNTKPSDYLPESIWVIKITMGRHKSNRFHPTHPLFPSILPLLKTFWSQMHQLQFLNTNSYLFLGLTLQQQKYNISSTTTSKSAISAHN